MSAEWYRVETQRQTSDEQGRHHREKAELVLATSNPGLAVERWLDLLDTAADDVEVRLISPAAVSVPATEGVTA